MASHTRQLSKKVCLLGDFSVGKTSLVRRYVEGRFDDRYLSTIGVKVDRKVLRLSTFNAQVELSLMLWDLAGGPRPGPASPSYYRGASGAIIVCDLTRSDTLSSVSRYVQELLAASPGAHIVLAANKVDLADERILDSQELTAVSTAHAAPLFLTSAKTGKQVKTMFRQLGIILVGG